MNTMRNRRLLNGIDSTGIHRVHTPSESYIKKSPYYKKNRSYFLWKLTIKDLCNLI